MGISIVTDCEMVINEKIKYHIRKGEYDYEFF